jgi:hypothetical protein
MTTTFKVNANSPEAIKFIEFARTLPFVEEKKTKRTHPCQFTVEELRERIVKGEEDYAAGRFVTSAELEKKMASW